MKFVCQNCKAKYQIDDEKVAGRNLKMKCRKCGAVIPISAVGSPGVSASGASGETPKPAGSAPQVKPSEPKQRPVAPGLTTASPATGRTVERKPTPPPRRATPGPGSRSSIVPRAPQGIAIAARGGAAAAAVLDDAPQDDALPRTALDERWSSLPPTEGERTPSTERATAERVSSAPGALAGAFQAALRVGGTDELGTPATARSGPSSSAAERAPRSGPTGIAAAVSEPPAAAEAWFVGIGGSPTGPLSLREIRAKAGAGLVDRESLVWREGFENWLPLRDFPELVAAVEEGVGASMSPGPAPVLQQPDPFAAPAGPKAPETSAVLASGGAVLGSPGAATASPAGDIGSSPANARVGAPPSAPNSAPVTAPSDFAPEEDLLPKRRSGLSGAALFAIAVAVAFGLTLGFVLFGGEKTKVVREVVQVPVASEAPPPAPTETAPPTEEPTGAAEPVASAGPSKGTAGSKGPAQTAPTNTPQQGLSGLSGLKGLASGPQTGPGTSSTGSASQPLDSSQIQSTVQRYTPSVRRSCWQPALDARDPNAPTSARVTVSITVGPDGKVRNASADGEPRGYPGLAGCITQRVRMWTFPPSNGTTTVQVPFVFAAQ